MLLNLECNAIYSDFISLFRMNVFRRLSGLLMRLMKSILILDSGAGPLFQREAHGCENVLLSRDRRKKVLVKFRCFYCNMNWLYMTSVPSVTGAFQISQCLEFSFCLCTMFTFHMYIFVWLDYFEIMLKYIYGI